MRDLRHNLRVRGIIIIAIFYLLTTLIVSAQQNTPPTVPPPPLDDSAPIVTPSNDDLSRVAINIFTASYGSDDGILRLDTMLNFQWNVQRAEELRLEVYRISWNNQIAPVKTMPIIDPIGQMDILARNLFEQSGTYYVVMVATNPDLINDNQELLLEVALPLTLPPYVQQAWVDAASAVDVCFVEGGEGAPLQWQLTNDSDFDFDTDTVQLMYDWKVRDVVGEILQSADGETDTGITTLTTQGGYLIQVTTYLSIGNRTYEIGETAALARDDFLCEESETDEMN